jgi:cysteinyl-tRNA synthetase
MALHLYNSLSRRLEPFEPLAPPRVTFYICGPTVWTYAHVGNFRTFVLGDMLARYLEYSGYQVFQIMNITDVDDRLINAAAEGGKTLTEHTRPFIEAFEEDRDYLRIRPADAYPRATESIPSMVSLVQRLMDRGLAYRADDGSVYFAVSRFATYGRLTQVDKRELKTGARVASDEYDKEHPSDFALWKAATSLDERVGAAWDAPFGRGRPGWHLECSAMALRELTERFGVETLDIHAGGKDLKFPHHENEIAQSEGVTGKPFARCWVHGEFLTVEGTKMSKRFGNYLTPRDLREEGIDPATVRLLMCQTHYRQELNFSDKGLRDAREAGDRIAGLYDRLVEVAGDEEQSSGAGDELEAAFREAMDDDLNAPRAVAAVLTFVRRANRALDGGEWKARDAVSARLVLDAVLDVLQIRPVGEEAVDVELARWVEQRLTERREARQARNFQLADEIRDELTARGIELEDTAEGTRWRLSKAARTG